MFPFSNELISHLPASFIFQLHFLIAQALGRLEYTGQPITTVEPGDGSSKYSKEIHSINFVGRDPPVERACSVMLWSPHRKLVISALQDEDLG